MVRLRDSWPFSLSSAPTVGNPCRPLQPESVSHPGKQAGQTEETSSVAVKSASPNCTASLSIPGWTETPNKVSLQCLGIVRNQPLSLNGCLVGSCSSTRRENRHG